MPTTTQPQEDQFSDIRDQQSSLGEDVTMRAPDGESDNYNSDENPEMDLADRDVEDWEDMETDNSESESGDDDGSAGTEDGDFHSIYLSRTE
jgi:hypothetical protein